MIDNRQIAEVIKRLKVALKDLPDPSVTLVGKKFKDPFLVLISCLLSLRTKDTTTLPICERLFVKYKSVDDFLTLTPVQLEKLIYPVGFYKTKARTIIEICKELKAKYGSQVPGDMDQLLSLKGVGRKTANLVLVEGFTKPGVCVDTHVHRISNRLGYVKTKDPLETEMSLRAKLPEKYWSEYNALLVMWGQNICAPISPKCSKCIVNTICERHGVLISR
jgi:endonuclease III